MATTDAKSGFRLPWTAERAEHDGEAPDGLPTSNDAGASDGGAVQDVAVSTASAASSAGTGRKPSRFLAELTRAMQAAAEQAREQTLTQFQADAKAFVELIHETSASDAAAIRTRADEDIAGVRDWSKAEMARIREETERRITARKADLEHQLEQHAAEIESRIERVHGTVTAFEAEMARFFERLLAEDDPSSFASLAENLPEPPAFDELLSEVARPVPESPVQPDPPVVEAVTPSPDMTSTTAPRGTDGNDQGDAPETGAVATADARADFDAAEAEAARAVRAESLGDGAAPADAASLMERLAGLTAGQAEPSGDAVATQVVVTGLVSVASIASFKRHLTRAAGVEGVSVTSGPDGEFVFAVSHRSDVALGDVVAALPGFGARITGTADGVLNVTAHDPESDA